MTTGTPMNQGGLFLFLMKNALFPTQKWGAPPIAFGDCERLCLFHKGCHLTYKLLLKISTTYREAIMDVQFLDTRGLKCPQPLLEIAMRAPKIRQGSVLEVLADCPTFEHDVRVWCERLGKTFLSVEEEGQYRKTIQIRF
jgi:TusA-related sulfurtransferase